MMKRSLLEDWDMWMPALAEYFRFAHDKIFYFKAQQDLIAWLPTLSKRWTLRNTGTGRWDLIVSKAEYSANPHPHVPVLEAKIFIIGSNFGKTVTRINVVIAE